MVGDAPAHAEDDTARRETTEAKNRAVNKELFMG